MERERGRHWGQWLGSHAWDGMNCPSTSLIYVNTPPALLQLATLLLILERESWLCLSRGVSHVHCYDWVVETTERNRMNEWMNFEYKISTPPPLPVSLHGLPFFVFPFPISIIFSNSLKIQFSNSLLFIILIFLKKIYSLCFKIPNISSLELMLLHMIDSWISSRESLSL